MSLQRRDNGVGIVVSTSMSSWLRRRRCRLRRYLAMTTSRQRRRHYNDAKTSRHRRRRCDNVDVIMTQMTSFRRSRGRHLRFIDVVVATLSRRHDDTDTLTS